VNSVDVIFVVDLDETPPELDSLVVVCSVVDTVSAANATLAARDVAAASICNLFIGHAPLV